MVHNEDKLYPKTDPYQYKENANVQKLWMSHVRRIIIQQWGKWEAVFFSYIVQIF